MKLRVVMLAVLAIVSGSLFPALSFAARSDVLVIVNDNSIDSPQVGEYYAQQRGIDPARIVHVKVPNKKYLQWAEFQSLRDQILRFGICQAQIDPALRPAACDNPSLPIYTPANVDALTANSAIGYIVLTRGVPPFMTVEGSKLADPNAPTSVDNYLRFWLARHFTSDVVLNFQDRANALNANADFAEALDKWRNTLRPIRPTIDREYVVGRIDGLDLATSKALVDRAIRAEQNGLFGKLFLNQDQAHLPWQHAFRLLDETRPECRDDTASGFYLNFPQNTPQGKTQPHCTVAVVRAQGTQHDSPPGLAIGRQPLPTNAVAYFGYIDGQTLEGGFPTLLNWRKDSNCTNTLCETAPDVAACRATSIDPFKEIDTRCVGVADGFMGYNFISYPLRNLGVWPTSWDPYTNDSAPQVDNKQAFDGNSSLSYGSFDEVPETACYGYSNGVLSTALNACAASTPFGIQQVATSSAIKSSSYRISMQANGAQLRSPAGFRLALEAFYAMPSGGSCPHGLQAAGGSECYWRLDANRTVHNTSGWQALDVNILAPAGAANLTARRLVFLLDTPPHLGQVLGTVNIDAVSVRAVDTNTELLVNGSFEQGNKQVGFGDYAATFLGRIGGTAFWGSMSHHESGGHSFKARSLRTLAFLLRGLPLGDAVWLGETRNSGIFYGDPLFSPTSVRFLRLADPDARITWLTSLRAAIVNGRGNTSPRLYQVTACRGKDPHQCDLAQAWQPLPGVLGTSISTTRPLTGAIVLDPSRAPFSNYGDYLLRLQTTSTHPVNGEQQTFNDYYPIKYRYSDTEITEGSIRVYSIRGRVVSADGDPIRNAQIRMTGDITRLAITDVNGRFEFARLPANSYSMTATHPGCTLSLVSGVSPVVIANQSVDLEFKCTAASTNSVSGRVVSMTGNVIPNVAISLVPVAGGTTILTSTSTSGFYQVGGLAPGSYTVRASLAGWAFSSQQVDLTGNAVRADVTGTLAAGAVRGFVRDKAGQPIAGIRVFIDALDDPEDGSQSFVIFTNAQGYFEQGGLTANQYSVYTNDSRFLSSPEDILVQRDAPPVQFSLSSAGSWSLSGYVLNGSTGRPTQWAVVTLIRPDGTALTATTSASGFYRFNGLADGTYQIRTPSYPQRSIIVSGGAVINVNFPEGL